MVSRLFYSIILLLLINADAKAIEASVTHACFSLDGAPYIEMYFHLLGPSVTNTIKDETSYSGEVEITIYFKRAGVIVDFDKYTLKSPASEEVQDFQDIKRYALESGAYDLEVLINDLHAADNKFEYKEVLSVPVLTDLSISEPQLMASVNESSETSETAFVKNGIGFESLPFDFLDNKFDALNFYVEVYNTSALNTECYLTFTIIDENDKEINKVYKKISNAAVVPVVQSIDVKGTPSGSYQLKVELFDRNKNLLKQSSKSFKRSNPDIDVILSQDGESSYRDDFVKKLDESKLDYHLRSLAPVLSNDQVSILNAVVKSDNKESKALYLYSHYSQYGESNAYKVFEKYSEVADAVHNMFYHGFGFGFESDRGHIYLKYGLPTSKITVENEPSAPPYEMWVYEVIESTRQKNVKFVFYNPTLVHNDFQLLHSTCRGEKFNVAWEIELYSNDPNEVRDATIDSEKSQDRMGRRAVSLFEDL